MMGNLIRDAFHSSRQVTDGFYHSLVEAENRQKQIEGEETAAQVLGGRLFGHYGTGRYVQSRSHHADQYAQFRGHPYSIIQTIANAVGKQPVRVAAIVDKHKHPQKFFFVKNLPDHLKQYQGRLRVFDQHEILDTLNDPNVHMVSSSLWFHTVASLQITGKSHWLITTDRSNGHRFQIWPLPSTAIEPIHRQDKLFCGWRLFSLSGASAIEVDNESVIPFWLPDPSDPLSAKSPMQALASAVMADYAAEQSQRKSFENGVNPGLAIMMGDIPGFGNSSSGGSTLKRESREQVREWVMRQYQGYMKDGLPIILDGIVKDVKRLNTTPREMDYLQTGVLSRDRLNEGFRVSKAVMGSIENMSRASSAVAEDHFNSNAISPLIRFISQTLTERLPSVFGYTGLQVFLEDAKADDPELEHEIAMNLYDRNLMTEDEIRSRYNLPPLARGDGKSSSKAGTKSITNGVSLESEAISMVAIESDSSVVRAAINHTQAELVSILKSAVTQSVYAAVEGATTPESVDLMYAVKIAWSNCKAKVVDCVINAVARGAAYELSLISEAVSVNGLTCRPTASPAHIAMALGRIGRYSQDHAVRCMDQSADSVAASIADRKNGATIQSCIERPISLLAFVIARSALESGRDEGRLFSPLPAKKSIDQLPSESVVTGNVNLVCGCLAGQPVVAGHPFVWSGWSYPGGLGHLLNDQERCHCVTRSIYEA